VGVYIKRKIICDVYAHPFPRGERRRRKIKGDILTSCPRLPAQNFLRRAKLFAKI
jgi:hypothetical protein